LSKTPWERDERWNLHQAALYGSSHYDLPLLLRWFTANIGIHHVRLPRVLRDHPEQREVGQLTLLQSFRCLCCGTRRNAAWYRSVISKRGGSGNGTKTRRTIGIVVALSSILIVPPLASDAHAPHWNWSANGLFESPNSTSRRMASERRRLGFNVGH
jgi:hypothetical protein